MPWTQAAPAPERVTSAPIFRSSVSCACTPSGRVAQSMAAAMVFSFIFSLPRWKGARNARLVDAPSLPAVGRRRGCVDFIQHGQDVSTELFWVLAHRKVADFAH